MKKVAIHSLGCKVNSYEAESMEIMLRDEGYEIVPFSEDVQADIYIINTCSVTNIADRKSRQMLHKAKKMNPEAVVVAAGCYVQADPDGVKKDECVDIILGNNMKISIVEALNDYFGGSDKTSYLVDINDKYQEYESLKINQTGEHTRAYIKIQDGCNQFCSYCIIPYVRGRVRSRKPEDIVNEVKTLAATGVKEVVLTGIHISSYGTDLENISLIELIEAIHEIEGIKRIRLGSLEPRIITEEFAKRIAGLEKICPHFHLSLQSGCDKTLKAMNRKYNTEEYYEGCVKLREVFDNPAADTVKSERSAVLLALEKAQSLEYRKMYIGKRLEVLIEELTEIDGRSYYTGYTKNYIRVAIAADEFKDNPVNDIYECMADKLICDGVTILARYN